MYSLIVGDRLTKRKIKRTKGKKEDKADEKFKVPLREGPYIKLRLFLCR